MTLPIKPPRKRRTELPPRKKQERLARMQSLLSDPGTFDQILATVTAGHGLLTWVRAHGLAYRSVLQWIHADPIRRSEYDQARILGAHALVEESIDLLDEPARLTPAGFVDNGEVNLRKARSEAKRWLAARLMPRLYGEQINIATTEQVDILSALQEVKRRAITGRTIEGETVPESPKVAAITRAIDPQPPTPKGE